MLGYGFAADARIYIYALKIEKILELLQRRGVIEIRSMLKEDSIFHKTDVQSKEGFEKI